MFFVLLLLTLGVALATSLLIVFLFRKPIRQILDRIIGEEIASGWHRFLLFAIFVVGVSSGVQIWKLEQYVHPERYGPREGGVVRALRSGLGLADLLHVLELHGRTPVPQNVAFSIKDWALRAGLMRLGADLTLSCDEPEWLRRFCQDPGTRRHLGSLVDDRTVRLKGRITPRRMQALLRELGYIVELEETLG